MLSTQPDELNLIKDNLESLSQQYQESFLIKIQNYSVQSESELLQTFADQITHEEDTIRSLIELADMLTCKCLDLCSRIQVQEEEMNDQINQLRMQIDYQNLNVQQSQQLYQEELDKNSELINQLYQTECKLERSVQSFTDLQNRLYSLDQERSSSQDQMERELTLQFGQAQHQLLKQLEEQHDYVKNVREANKNLVQQIHDLQIKQVNLENEIQRLNRETKEEKSSKKHPKIKSLQIENENQGATEYIPINRKFAVNPFVKDPEKQEKQEKSAICNKNLHAESLTELTINMSQKIMKESCKQLSLITEEQNPIMFHFNEQSEIVKQMSVLNEPACETQSSDSGTLVEIKESLQDIYKESNFNLEDQLQTMGFSQLQNYYQQQERLYAIDQAYAYNNKQSCFRNSEPQRYTYNDKADARRQSQAAQYKQTNPYHDFFKMVCQCAKLNSKRFDKIVNKDLSSYYTQFLDKQIPFNKWYRYLSKKLEEA